MTINGSFLIGWRMWNPLLVAYSKHLIKSHNLSLSSNSSVNKTLSAIYGPTQENPEPVPTASVLECSVFNYFL